MKISELWKDQKKRRQALTLLLSFVLYAFIISRIFAYYSSSDSATNRISSKTIGLELYEPAWDVTGSAMAKKSEPGMVIPKDPYAQNTGGMDETVRLKLEIRLDESNAQLPNNDPNNREMIRIANDTERKIAILQAILNRDAAFAAVTMGDSTAAGNSIPVRGADDRIYTVSYQDTQFLIEDASTGSSETAFDFYFYYIGNNPIGGTEGQTEFTRLETSMKTLAPGEATPRLFEKLVYPIYKKDYLTIFDQGYEIRIYAEGILCHEFAERGLPQTVENFKRIAAE